ncbi:MAG: hypothetical protein U1F34_05160 [Gammaproteobacteria bacterium]
MRLPPFALRSLAVRRSRCPVVPVTAELPPKEVRQVRWLHRLTAAGFMFFLLKGMVWMALGMWVLQK